MDNRVIQLTNGRVAYVSPEDYPRLIKMQWIAIRPKNTYYAINRQVLNGRVKIIKMHRLIANTPRDQICHHRNGNGLDNRRRNLQNMYALEHRCLHKYYESKAENPRKKSEP